LKAKQYRPQLARWVYIPKDEKSKQPLGIPVQEDKIEGKGLSRILESIYQADFLECSHGFRPNRGCHTALKAIDTILLNKPINHVIEADIKGFFDTVSHKWMTEFLGRRIKDPSLLRIIGRFLTIILWYQRQLPGSISVLLLCQANSVKVVESEKPAEIVQLATVYEVHREIPHAETVYSASTVYTIACEMSSNEESDIGNLQVRFREGC
jgi:hypothetical protein